MKFILIAILFSSVAQAQTVITRSYDQYGNAYTTRSDQFGSTTWGNNVNNMTQWNQSSDRMGNMTGTDSNRNQWNYQRGANRYQNLGTGQSCFNGVCN